MKCLSDYCNLEITSCILNFCILISNSLSMAMTCYNLHGSEFTEAIISIVSLSISIICVSIKQSLHLEEKIKNKKIQSMIDNKKLFIDI